MRVYIFADPVIFPEELFVHYGLTTELLSKAFQCAQVCFNQVNAAWCLPGSPNVGFYRMLHLFLQKWDKTKLVTKTSIGKLYLSIDRQLQQEKANPMGAYRFIERVIYSNKPDSELMPYSMEKRFDQLEGRLHATEGEVYNLAEKVKNQENELKCMKTKFEDAERELTQTKKLLGQVTHENEALQRQKVTAHKKVIQINKFYEASLSDLMCVEDELFSKAYESEESCQEDKISSSSHVETMQDGPSLCNFQTKEGNQMYSHAIRQLYYSLLADQIPPAKISRTITSVLNCFVPSLNTSNLQLPHERCAGYMRREELHTISNIHKACSVINCKTLNANSDGTTKFQKKLGGVAVNGLVLCLGEVPDGSAESMIELIEAELEKLRTTARDLKLSNPEKINWTLFPSSTSDSASTQKKFNRLVKEHQEKDRLKYGAASAEAVELVENFCAMHLGSNLRKAFLDGTRNVTCSDTDQCGAKPFTQREHYSTDTFIHEFCKLFGRQGVPEYGCGTINFPDFLSLQQSKLKASEASYYHSCLEVQLERQVGSRYFVSACNACKVLYLIKAAKDFLEYTGKDTGNNLETTVYHKIQSANELSQLKADAIMFYFVYADLVMLAKSNKLNKSAFDMNQHYLELQNFLGKVGQNPEIVMNKDYKVFTSEDRLYGSDKNINHRIRNKNLAIYKHLFQANEWDKSLLYPNLAAGASKMKDKLSDYAKAQLPGGKYWKPKPAISAVLKTLKPSNDVCESILGLNDYLTTAIPNMHQMTGSNLVEMKKNGTVKWYQELSPGMKQTVTTIAIKKRQEVMKKCQEEEFARSKRRQENMECSHQRRMVMRERVAKEQQHLSQQHLVTTTLELKKAIDEINSDANSTSSKKLKRSLSLIRMQINIRKKVLNQKVNIPFSHKGKQRPLSDIVKDITEFIAAHPQTTEMNPDALMVQPDINDPVSLIGREILHRFKLDSGKYKWFSGVVISYNAKHKTHEIAYDSETDHCHFNLVNDIRDGDLKIVT